MPRRPDYNGVADRIGASLRRVFDEAAAEPIPDEFEALLQRLR